MNLDGGINTYICCGDEMFGRYKSGISPKGRKVIFLNDNGYDSEREYANLFFKENQILTVKEIYVGRSSSEVEFEEIPNKRFNTVMFQDI